MLWDWDFTLTTVLPALLKAVRITVAATFFGFALAIFVGLLLTWGRSSKFKPLRWTAASFIEFVRSTPLLVQLYLIFFGLPTAGIQLPAFAAGVVGLGFHYGTYLSEVFRAGIEAIPQGQWEAAAALNFSSKQTWLRIVLPQAIPPVLPVLGNYLVTMFKETPLLSSITVVEMVQAAKIVGTREFSFLEPFTMVGLLFMLLSYPSALLIRRLEVKLGLPGSQRAKAN